MRMLSIKNTQSRITKDMATPNERMLPLVFLVLVRLRAYAVNVYFMEFEFTELFPS